MKLFVIAAVATIWLPPIPAQSQTPCWHVPNGLNITIECANGYWQTVTPEGEVITGNGITDPNASARGSGIVNKSPGSLGPNVTAPTQILPLLEPHQGYLFGLPPRRD